MKVKNLETTCGNHVGTHLHNNNPHKLREWCQAGIMRRIGANAKECTVCMLQRGLLLNLSSCIVVNCE